MMLGTGFSAGSSTPPMIPENNMDADSSKKDPKVLGCFFSIPSKTRSVVVDLASHHGQQGFVVFVLHHFGIDRSLSNAMRYLATTLTADVAFYLLERLSERLARI